MILFRNIILGGVGGRFDNQIDPLPPPRDHATHTNTPTAVPRGGACTKSLYVLDDCIDNN